MLLPVNCFSTYVLKFESLLHEIILGRTVGVTEFLIRSTILRVGAITQSS